MVINLHENVWLPFVSDLIIITTELLKSVWKYDAEKV